MIDSTLLVYFVDSHDKTRDKQNYPNYNRDETPAGLYRVRDWELSAVVGVRLGVSCETPAGLYRVHNGQLSAVAGVCGSWVQTWGKL